MSINLDILSYDDNLFKIFFVSEFNEEKSVL